MMVSETKVNGLRFLRQTKKREGKQMYGLLEKYPIIAGEQCFSLGS